MKAITSPFRSNFFLWNGVSAIFFSNCITHVHSHNTLQILVDIQSGFRCRVGEAEWQSHKSLIIKEEAPHQLDTAGSVQLIIYLDTATTAAQQIQTRYLPNLPSTEPDLDLLSSIKPDQWQQALLTPNPENILHIVQQILQTLTTSSTTKPDPRVSLTERTITHTDPSQLSITTLASNVHLSESRLRALFKTQTGISLYKYILWSRIRFAINRIMNGSPIGDAALEAGFTDSSHFHKMLVTMFGISPSQFLKDHRTMQILTCDQSPLSFETKVYDANGQVEKIYK
ncbi:MAG: helix-turn-helix transcriptional regulator [Bacteroidetes bacterium]|nr:helix-turn-helix transcriptional regulator [Bacteroidota bacterium]